MWAAPHPTPVLAAPAPHTRPWRRFLAAWVVIAICAPVSLITIVGASIVHPLIFPLILIPAVILGGALWWVDRLEPEPLDSLLLAVAWGGTVAIVIGLVFNVTTAAVAGEAAAMVGSAPVFEELGKALVFWVLVRRRALTSPMDGVVYGIAVATGFALIEDFIYFAMGAGQNGTEGLIGVFVLRGIFTPFAHSLFTIWIGIAIGWVVQRRPGDGVGVVAVAAGYGVAVLSHAAWNGGSLIVQTTGSAAAGGLLILGFVGYFLFAVATVTHLRRRQAAMFTVAVPTLAVELGMDPAEVAVIGDARRAINYRKTLPRPQRRRFDALRQRLRTLAEVTNRPARTPAEAHRNNLQAHELVGDIQAIRRALLDNPRPVMSW